MSLIELQPFTLRREWTVEDIPVLTACITLPEPTGADTRIQRRIRRYYHLQQRAYLRYCEGFLLPRAEAEFRAALASSAPLPCFRAELSFSVTYREGTLLSLYTQSAEHTLPGQRLLRRWGDTWDLAVGYPAALPDFFPPRSDWRKALRKHAEAEMRHQEAAGLARYHEDAARLLRKHFNARSFYLTPEGLAFFFPMLTLGPAAEGIPVFTLPFGAAGLRLPEAKQGRR